MPFHIADVHVFQRQRDRFADEFDVFTDALLFTCDHHYRAVRLYRAAQLLHSKRMVYL